ncbi:unnamed protein product [Parnassius apollo]|uniref:(apollo) hypothetical protein n=1 Tax=Parnassius apollo TaxID=110799 RepID=A0A8S3XD95_PARAO|nr:unnamed protein product [Parnassius apollo]
MEKFLQLQKEVHILKNYTLVNNFEGTNLVKNKRGAANLLDNFDCDSGPIGIIHLTQDSTTSNNGAKISTLTNNMVCASEPVQLQTQRSPSLSCAPANALTVSAPPPQCFLPVEAATAVSACAESAVRASQNKFDCERVIDASSCNVDNLPNENNNLCVSMAEIVRSNNKHWKDKEQNEEWKIVQRKSQTRLILPANCIAKIDGYKIEPTQEILDSVKSESLVGDKYVFGDLPELKLDTIDFDSTNIASARLKRANEVFKVSAPQVEANCIAKIDGYKIEPTQEILDSVKSESLVGDKYVFGDLPELNLDTIDFDSTNIASARLKRANEVFNVSAPQVEGSVAKLSDLITNSRNATKTYHSDIEILTNEIIKLKKKVAEDAAAGFSIGRSHRVFEIPIELCTVPGRAMAWSCTPSKGYTQLLEQNQSIKRWSNAMVMKLDLRQISLVNSDYPSLKWSQNVPSKVKVNLNHLGHIINHHARWDWLSLNIVSVTGLGISFPGTFRYIYHYSKPASVNYPHTGAVTVDDEWDGDLEL